MGLYVRKIRDEGWKLELTETWGFSKKTDYDRVIAFLIKEKISFCVIYSEIEGNELLIKMNRSCVIKSDVLEVKSLFSQLLEYKSLYGDLKGGVWI